MNPNKNGQKENETNNSKKDDVPLSFVIDLDFRVQLFEAVRTRMVPFRQFSKVDTHRTV